MKEEVKCLKCGFEGKGSSRLLHWYIVAPVLLFLFVALRLGADGNYGSAMMVAIVVILPLLLYGTKSYCPKCGSKEVAKK